MKHYRINKLAAPGGAIVKKKDILANNAKQAVEIASRDPDCPICEVWHAGEKISAAE